MNKEDKERIWNNFMEMIVIPMIAVGSMLYLLIMPLPIAILSTTHPFLGILGCLGFVFAIMVCFGLDGGGGDTEGNEFGDF